MAADSTKRVIHMQKWAKSPDDWLAVEDADGKFTYKQGFQPNTVNSSKRPLCRRDGECSAGSGNDPKDAVKPAAEASTDPKTPGDAPKADDKDWTVKDKSKPKDGPTDLEPAPDAPAPPQPATQDPNDPKIPPKDAAKAAPQPAPKLAPQAPAGGDQAYGNPAEQGSSGGDSQNGAEAATQGHGAGAADPHGGVDPIDVHL